MRVDLFYLSPNLTGGWVTFTAHLYRALTASGCRVTLYKLGKSSENSFRDFGYGIKYRNITLAEAVASPRCRLIVAAAKSFRAETRALYESGATLVVHDPTELKNLPSIGRGSRCVVIRRAGLKYLPDATFIRHPYQRRGNSTSEPRTINAVCLSRVDFDKHTDVIIHANRLLPPDQQVQLYGAINRRYAFLKLTSVLPNWKDVIQPYPREIDAAYRLLTTAQYAVDMSLISGDGGGTQYTTLEAWDAGAVPVIQDRWVHPNDDMRPDVNCIVVDGVNELASVLSAHTETRAFNIDALRQSGYEQLHLHDPLRIGNEYRAFLQTHAND